MPAFPTPDPIVVALDLAAGDAHISAGERDDTVVEVAPRDASRRADVRAAEQTHVELIDGKLVVRTPRQGLSLSRGGAVDVTILLPAGSRLHGRTGAGELHADGTLADCTFKTGAGAIRLGATGSLAITGGAGDVTVDRVAGDVKVATGSGTVRIGELAGAAVIKSGNGPVTIGEAGGDVRVMTANGDVSVGRAGSGLVAKTANGSLRVDVVARGAVDLSTGSGSIDVGIAEGTAARLDVKTHFGHVDQQLDAADAPPPSGDRVDVRGRTGFGDITVRRA